MMNSASLEEILKILESNNNTGMQYEIISLMSVLDILHERNEIENDVYNLIFDLISKRKDYDKVKLILQNVKDVKNAIYRIEELNGIRCNVEEIRWTTQDDNVGCSDILLTSYIGLSVKGKNKNIFNPSISTILNSEIALKITKVLNTYLINEGIKKYVNGMTCRYGYPVFDDNGNHPLNWNRKESRLSQKLLSKTAEVISKKINSLSESEKNHIVSKLLENVRDSIVQNNIKAYTIILKNRDVDVYENDNSIVDEILNDIGNVSTVSKNTYVIFNYKQHEFGRLQVKFNNGLIQPVKIENGKTKNTNIIELCGRRFEPGKINSLNFAYTRMKKII